MPAMRPDQVVQQFPAVVRILVGVESWAAGQCDIAWKKCGGSGERRDLRMWAVPVQVVLARAEARFVGQVRTEQMNVAKGALHGVIVQSRNEIFVWRPNEVRLAELVEKNAPHEAVLLAGSAVVEPFDRFLAINGHGRRERQLSDRKVAVARGGSRKFGQQLPGERSWSGVLRHKGA